MAKIYNVLFGGDFFYNDLGSAFEKDSELELEIGAVNAVVASIKKVFEDRHIACHEFKNLDTFDNADLVERLLSMIVLFHFLETKLSDVVKSS